MIRKQNITKPIADTIFQTFSINQRVKKREKKIAEVSRRLPQAFRALAI